MRNIIYARIRNVQRECRKRERKEAASTGWFRLEKTVLATTMARGRCGSFFLLTLYVDTRMTKKGFEKKKKRRKKERKKKEMGKSQRVGFAA